MTMQTTTITRTITARRRTTMTTQITVSRLLVTTTLTTMVRILVFVQQTTIMTNGWLTNYQQTNKRETVITMTIP